ncbi:MAG: helical backbone metal receptor, partial [Chitinophagales bacterium]
EKNIIGGTKNLNIRQILDLEPDLIIANKEENRKTQVEKLQEFCPVYISDVRNIAAALEMITDIGRLTQKEREANKIALDIEVKFANFKPQNQEEERVAYLIWKEPLMVVGNDNFIHSLLEWAGWINVFGDQARYPSITESELKAAKPDQIMLSTEPYNFSEKDIPYFKSLLPMAKVQLVDGERFSWYGSRMKQAPAYIHAIRNS